MYEKFMVWLVENWIVTMLPLVGALVAHLKDFESRAQNQTVGWHAYGYFSRLVYAGFAAFLAGAALDYLYTPAAVPKQLGWILVGLCSVRPDAALNWMFDYMTTLANKWKAKPEKPNE